MTREAGSLNVYTYTIPCNIDTTHSPDGRATGNQVIFLENYAEGPLPNPLNICGLVLWAEPSQLGAIGQTETFDATTIGNVGVQIDVQQRFAKAANFPIAQNILNKYTNLLGWLEAQPGYPRMKLFEYNDVPYCYRPGDAVNISPEFRGGGVINLVSVFKHDAGDLVPGWLANNYAPYIPVWSNGLTTCMLNQSQVSARNLIPLSITAPATKVRAHVMWPYAGANGQSTVISSISVCLQASGSTGASSPIEMTINGQSGVTLFPSQDIWTDWTSIDIPIGSNLLVTVSYFKTPSANIAVAQTGATHEWTSLVDSTLSVTMLGPTIYDNPGFSVGIDRVQVQ